MLVVTIVPSVTIFVSLLDFSAKELAPFVVAELGVGQLEPWQLRLLIQAFVFKPPFELP